MALRNSRPLTRCDFTHFDVPDFREVIPEAFEMVEKGFVTEHDFREFTFTNAAMLYARNNPGFFKGTVAEQAVAEELGLKEHRPPRPLDDLLAESWERNTPVDNFDAVIVYGFHFLVCDRLPLITAPPARRLGSMIARPDPKRFPK